MNEPIVTTEQAGRCLVILKEATEPMVAADIGTRLHLTGTRESQRRYVREIISQLREGGAMIVATIRDGYWLTEDEAMWRDYNEHREIDAKRILGETSHRKKMLADKQGQGLLFTNRIPAGVATVGAN